MYINTYSNHYQQTIDHFHGAYAFLSNFYPSRIYYRGYWYANNEAAFQAQKTISPKEQLQFTKLRNPKDAKKLGREVQLRSDWESVKLMYMYEICMCKFMQNPTLYKALLATGNCHLVEGNNWGDYFWGSVNGHGENHLCKILMDIRAKLQFEC